jgi:hypothetical protein
MNQCLILEDFPVRNHGHIRFNSDIGWSTCWNNSHSTYRIAQKITTHFTTSHLRLSLLGVALRWESGFDKDIHQK